jgi:Acid Phosphatase
LCVLADSAHALAEINQMKADGYDIQAAVASKTDEPAWAHFCMQHLAIPTKSASNTTSECNASDNNNKNNEFIPMKDCFMMTTSTSTSSTTKSSSSSSSLIEIAFDNKQYHFRQLHKKTGIPYEDMVFFDNEYGNIRSVSQLGVHSVYTPDGMQHKHWEDVKKEFGLFL